MTARLFPLALALLALPGAALAIEPVAPALQDMANDLAAGGGRVVWQDFDGDGAVEALVWAAGPDGAPGTSWELLAGAEPQVVFRWEAASTEVIPTDPQGAVIQADGITWAWDGRRVRPHYDLVIQNIQNITPPLPKDREMLAAVGFTDLVDEYTQVLRLDLLPAVAGRESIVALADEMYRGADFSTPYFIFTEEGELLLQGLSIFHPAIFSHPDGGLSLIEETGAGMSLVRLGEPQAAADPDPDSQEAQP
jgi:hypothetical protein